MFGEVVDEAEDGVDRGGTVRKRCAHVPRNSREVHEKGMVRDTCPF